MLGANAVRGHPDCERAHLGLAHSHRVEDPARANRIENARRDTVTRTAVSDGMPLILSATARAMGVADLGTSEAID